MQLSKKKALFRTSHGCINFLTYLIISSLTQKINIHFLFSFNFFYPLKIALSAPGYTKKYTNTKNPILSCSTTTVSRQLSAVRKHFLPLVSIAYNYQLTPLNNKTLFISSTGFPISHSLFTQYSVLMKIVSEQPILKIN